MKPPWRASVRVSLTVWYVAAMVVVLAVYAAIVLAFVSHGASRALDDRLHENLRWVAEMADQNPDGTLVWFEGDDGSGDDERPWLQVWSPSGRLLLRSQDAEARPIPDSWTLASHADGQIQSLTVAASRFRILSARATIGGEPVVIQVAATEARMTRELRDLTVFLIFGLPLGVAVAGLGGYSLARRALAPVDRMTERARSITAERLSDRLPVGNPHDELGRLATVFNAMLGSLESSFEQMGRFSADVSHEIRTPLTAIRSVGEVGLRGARDAHAYRGIIGSMLEEVDRLSLLVERLLELSRAEAGQTRLAREIVNLGELVDDVAAHLGVLAEEKQQSLEVERAGAPTCAGDRMMLRQALINLVDNAIKYTPAGGRVRLTTLESADAVTIDISDSGPGIATEPRARIFDRFVRGRSRSDVGGAGLGLSLAKWAVEAHGGILGLERTAASGSTFRITLPKVRPGPGDHRRQNANLTASCASRGDAAATMLPKVGLAILPSTAPGP
jgi:heavy metal sensor kinase